MEFEYSLKSPKKTWVGEKKSIPISMQSNRLSDSDIELLITEVEKRVPLWNLNLAISERNRQKSSKLWEEVSAALDGKLNAAECKKKFKSLRDTYRKIVQNEMRSSGSTRVNSRDEWKYYRYCKFLRDSCLIRSTKSGTRNDMTHQYDDHDSDEIKRDDEDLSVGLHDDLNDNVDEAIAQDSGFVSNKRTCKRLLEDITDSATALNRIADVMCRKETQAQLPEPQKLDHVGGFLIGIGHQLRQLPEKLQMETIIEILQLIKRKNDENM